MADPLRANPLHDAVTLIASVDAPLTQAQNPSSLTPSSGTGEGSGPRPIVASRYQILGLVGSGGMGTVYRVRDSELDEIVALKILRPEVADRPEIVERFRREAKLARRVTHNNVARVFDIGEEHGERFMTMELVQGESLAGRITRRGALPLNEAVSIATSICAGLEAAHAAGVVHRDLKPDNVLLSDDGRVVVTDFGIARACTTELGSATSTMGMMLGTPVYMAPEQVEGRADIDGRADIYALGGVLFEMLTGERPWLGESPLAIATARLYQSAPDPRHKRSSVPAWAAEITMRCLSRRREDRFGSAADVSAALARGASSTSSAIDVGRDSASAGRSIAAPTVVTPHDLAAMPEACCKSREKAIAVLPFRNTGKEEDSYLAEEITDDLIDALSMTPGLKVQARGAVQRWRDKNVDAREVGKALGVQVVVEGSVRRASGKLRVNARLISVDDGFQLWAKRFDRAEHDALEVNDEAAKAIAEVLTVDQGPASRAKPSSPEATDLYLRARHEYRKFWPNHLEKAIELFEKAVALAPDDAAILSGLALARSRACFFLGTGLDLAVDAANRAIAKAPEQGDPHLALGAVLLQLGEPVRAVRELRLAVNKAPNLHEAQAALGRMLIEIGEVEEGIRRLETAALIDPEVPLANETLARVYALLNQWDKVEAPLEKGKNTVGQVGYWTNRTRLIIWRRDKENAEKLLSELSEIDRFSVLPRMGLELVARGVLPWERTDFSFSRTSEGSPRRRMFMGQVEAETRAYVGDVKGSLDALERAVGAGLIDLLWFERCPILEIVRSDAHYEALHKVMSSRTAQIRASYHGIGA